MRGEHHEAFAALSRALGSSPHARGTREVAAYALPSSGIIPACAGNTMSLKCI